MNRRRLVSLVALAAFILAAPLTALGGSPASVCPAGLTGSFPLCSIMPTFAGVNAESRLLPSGELGAETFLRTEDFTTYTEVDPGADITVAASTITMSSMDTRNSTSYVAKDFGTARFDGDFSFITKINLSAISHTSLFSVVAVSDELEELNTVDTNGNNYLALMVYGQSGSYIVSLYDCWGGGLQAQVGAVTLTAGTDYWVKYYRDESVSTYGTLYAEIYSDASLSTLVESVSKELRIKTDFRYVYGVSSYDNGVASKTVSGTVSYLQLDTANYFDGNLVVKANGGEARFEPDGYVDEPERTNLLKSSRVLDVDDANWSGTVAAEDCVQGEIGIDGTAVAWTLTDNNVETSESIYQDVVKVATDTSDYTFTLYVGKTTSATVYPSMVVYFSGGTATYSETIIDTNNGAVYDRDSHAANSKTISSQGEFWKVSVAFNDVNGDCTGVRAQFSPTRATALDGSVDFTAQGSVVFDWAQLENASVASSPIYTTSTAVTRPADSFSLTMSDEFKEKFAEALGSELAPDFGVVLGEELITDENDRTFSDGDVGNWTLVETGSSADLSYDSTVIGGFDDKQLKLTAEAGEDSAYAALSSVGGANWSVEANSYYLMAARVYLDPSADQNKVNFYIQALTGSVIIASRDGSGSSNSTINKGVWEEVWTITYVDTDTAGTIRIGFDDTGNLTANDIAYIDNISLRKITFSDDWTAGDGWGPKFALTAPSLGDEELSNGDFSSVTEGSDLFDSGVGDYRDNTGSWIVYDNNTIANDSDALLITWVDNANGAYLYMKNSADLTADLESGHQYRVTFSAKVESGETVTFGVYDGTSYHNNDITETSFTEYVVDFVALSGGPFPVRCGNMDASNDKIWVRDFTIKEITPTGHTVIDTNLAADTYVEADDSAGTLRIVSGGDSVGVIQSGITTPGDLYIAKLVVTNDGGGKIGISAAGSETYDKPLPETARPIVATSTGTFQQVFRAGGTDVSLQELTSGSTDMTVSEWSIKPYTPSHVNTYYDFKGQEEGSDAVTNGDFANWTGDDPDDWFVGNEDANNYVTETVGGAAQVVSNDTAAVYVSQAISVTENTRRKLTFDITINTLGWRFDLTDVSNTADIIVIANYATDGSQEFYYTVPAGCSSVRIRFWRNTDGASDFEVDNVVDVPVTLSDYTGNNWYPYDADGGAIFNGSLGYILYQTAIAVADTYYLYLFKISNYSAGTIRPYAGNGGEGSAGTEVSADGVYSEIIKYASGDTNRLALQPDGSFRGVVDYFYIIPLSSPVAHCTGSQSTYTDLQASNILTVGSDYKSTFTIDNRSAGELYRVYFGSDSVLTKYDSDDDYQLYKEAIGSTHFFLRADADFVGDITALSVKEVTRHAQGTMLLAWTPGWSKQTLNPVNIGLMSVKGDAPSLAYLYTNSGIYSTDGSSHYGSQTALSYAANTTYLIAIQWGDVLSNVNNMRVGAAAIDSAWTSAAWGSDAEFDGDYSLGTDLDFFYGKFGSNNLRDLMFFDSILTDAEIENIRRRIK
jgi:hypothetical protein